MKIAVVGAGWAGLAAAIAAVGAGHHIALFEAGRALGGRARALPVQLPNGRSAVLDNGQHIMIGAYSRTLRMMREVGVDPEQTLLRLPLTLRFPDGAGLALPDWPAPWDAAAGVLSATGWRWRDKASLLRAMMRWRRAGFQCGEGESVAALCDGLTPRVRAELIEPLCVSALNTPVERSSAQVFLRVLRDGLFGPGEGRWRASNLLLPRCDLGTLFPDAASRWLKERGASLHTARRVQAVSADATGWRVDGERFDAVVLACPAREAARLIENSGAEANEWVRRAQSLRYEAIATIYASGPHRLALPMLALRSGPGAPAQFVFDRAQLGGPSGLLAFVVSASQGDHDTLQRQVLSQARAVGWDALEAVQTVVERRATFACMPGVRRPSVVVAPGLLACGDYVEGPYPSTLEGAVRSALEAVARVT
jgi:squalene-associated FAD-dependent desaturase